MNAEFLACSIAQLRFFLLSNVLIVQEHHVVLQDLLAAVFWFDEQTSVEQPMCA